MARRGKVYVKGAKKVRRNMEKAVKETKLHTTEALSDFAMRIHRSANTHAPLIPRDTGNLIQGRFVVNDKGKIPFGSAPRFSSKDRWGRYHRGRARRAYLDHQRVLHKYLYKAKASDNPVAYFGYTPDYALFVHELGITVRPEDAPIKWSRPGSGPHFFTAAVNRESDQLLRKASKKMHVRNIKSVKARKPMRYY